LPQNEGKICLNTPAGLDARRNELPGGFPGTELETDTPVRKFTMNILCIRKGWTKHHEPFLYFSGNDTACSCGTLVMHREGEKLIAAHACVPFSRNGNILAHSPFE
jgi:hypothetical protein